MSAPLTSATLPASACTAMSAGSFGEDLISKQVFDGAGRHCQVNFRTARKTLDPIFHPAAADAAFHFANAADRKVRMVFLETR